MKRNRIFDDEIDAKAVFDSYQKRPNKNYYNLNTNPYERKYNYSKEVVVKITSSGTNSLKIRRHIDYITRKGKLDICDDEYTVYKDIDGNIKKYAYNVINNEQPINDNDNKRETLNIVFSQKNATTEQIKSCAYKTLKELYPDANFIIVMHNDTDHPHCHVILKLRYANRIINPNIQELKKIRATFSKYLNELGVEAEVKNNFNKKRINLKKDIGNNGLKEIVDFGVDKYKHDAKNQESFFVRYKLENGKEVEIWSKELKEEFENSNVKVGDKIKMDIIDKQDVSIPIRDKLTGKVEKYVAGVKNIWNITIVQRNPEKKESGIEI